MDKLSPVALSCKRFNLTNQCTSTVNNDAISIKLILSKHYDLYIELKLSLL